MNETRFTWSGKPLQLICLLLILLFLSSHLPAQTYLLEGTVLDSETEEPISFASVFINTTTMGTTTDADGEFSMELPSGSYELVISFVGYEPVVYEVDMIQELSGLLFKLNRTEYILEEVEIKAERGAAWYDNLEIFKRYFLGTSTFARQCNLLNPEVLSFSTDANTGVLTARARDMLQIENQAMGYDVSYLLIEFQHDENNQYFTFVGYPKYTEMEGNKRQQRRWERNRRQAYNGSIMHFVRILREERLEEEGFILRRLLRRPGMTYFSDKKMVESLVEEKIPYNEYIRHDSNEVILQYKGFFQVVYTREKEELAYVKENSSYNPYNSRTPDYQKSVISLNAPFVKLEKLGNISEPLGILFEGYWGWEKFANMLPLDYQPEED